MLTTLSDEACNLMGNIPRSSLGKQLAVNINNELCGAFINTMNVTYVNYTVNAKEKADNNRLQF